VYPALTVADSIRKQQPSAVHAQRADNRNVILGEANASQNDELLYIGRANSIEERLVQRAQIPFESIDVGGVRGLAPWTAAKNLWRVYRAIGRVRALIRSFTPDAIFVTGGYVSAPVIWAGALEKIPSVIYLPDLEPGWAIRATAHWATQVAISFPKVAQHFNKGKTTVTGYPVRQAFFQTDRTRARQRFNLDPDEHTITIFGGSQGAHHINQVAAQNLEELAQIAQLIFITGRNDEAWMKEQVTLSFRAEREISESNSEISRRQKTPPRNDRSRIRVFGYLDEELPDALAAADVVIARAGAATLGEFPALGLPAILVPYPHSGKHQDCNADFLVERGAAIKIDDANLETELIPTIRKLFVTTTSEATKHAPTFSTASALSRTTLLAMTENMRALSQPNAAENIVALLEQLSQYAIRNKPGSR
jgi:UDP-N-acetylglucosamine--N-acetylmuramyl-(pentapeptide) pyrophosphoryl-undecaprenol N-acetylglucosamine transferase